MWTVRKFLYVVCLAVDWTLYFGRLDSLTDIKKLSRISGIVRDKNAAPARFAANRTEFYFRDVTKCTHIYLPWLLVCVCKCSRNKSYQPVRWLHNAEMVEVGQKPWFKPGKKQKKFMKVISWYKHQKFIRFMPAWKSMILGREKSGVSCASK